MSKKKVLLIDDESGFTRLLKLTLPAYEVREVNDPLKALDAVRQFRPDIIFLDVIMPNLDGGTVASMIREDPSLKDIPIVFLTAILKPDEKPPTNEKFLPKPVSKDAIVQCITETLGP